MRSLFSAWEGFRRLRNSTAGAKRSGADTLAGYGTLGVPAAASESRTCSGHIRTAFAADPPKEFIAAILFRREAKRENPSQIKKTGVRGCFLSKTYPKWVRRNSFPGVLGRMW